VKNPRTGEVYVDGAVPCDFERVPDGFEDVIAGTLGHASRVCRFITVMRDLVLPDDHFPRQRILELLEQEDGSAGAENASESHTATTQRASGDASLTL
jgi:hypothetical protein